MKRILTMLGVLLLALSGGWPSYDAEPISHYPGTIRFVPPWRRGRPIPTHPDYRYEEDDEDRYAPGYCYCKHDLVRRLPASEVWKPRATRE